jgi:hypothetical protein
MGAEVEMGRYYLVYLFFLNTVCGFAQSTDIMRLEYTMLPKNDSEVQTARWRFLFNLPVKVGVDQYLVTGAEYNQIDFDNSGTLPFDGSELKSLHVIDLNLGYIFKWNPNWRFVGIVSPRLASNFIEGVQSDDLRLNFSAAFWKEDPDAEKPFRLVIGLSYNSATGLPVPLPLINYYRRFHPNWAYVLGIPKSSFRYYFNDRHIMETAVFLDGYFVNLQDDILLDDGNIGSSISLSTVVGAFEYQYKISKRLSFYGIAGYAFFQNGLLRNDKRKNVYVLNKEGNIYFRTGLKISIF